MQLLMSYKSSKFIYISPSFTLSAPNLSRRPTNEPQIGKHRNRLLPHLGTHSAGIHFRQFSQTKQPDQRNSGNFVNLQSWKQQKNSHWKKKSSKC